MLHLACMIVRATKKLRDALKRVDLAEAEPDARGEVWYANLVTFSRQRWLLLMHEETLFPVVIRDVRAADLRRFAQLVTGEVAVAAGDAGLRVGTFGHLNPIGVRIAATDSKRMLGLLSRMHDDLDYAIQRAGGPKRVDIPDVNRFLVSTLLGDGSGRDYVRPIDLARDRAARLAGVVDINGYLPGPAGALSNFTPNAFVFRSRAIPSMEGLLQSLKCPDPARQVEIQQLLRLRAKQAGDEHDWRATQTLWWDGRPIDRHGPDYQALLDEAFDALAAQNADWREALLATGEAPLVHTIGSDDPRRTVLTEHELCSRLEAIRRRLRG